MTALEELAQHPATIELKKLGLSNDQLASISFTKAYRSYPLDEWVMTWGSDTIYVVRGNVVIERL